MHKLIVKKYTAVCALPNFDCAHYFEHCLFNMFITPKHLNLSAGGMPSGNLDNIPDEGYRTPVASKITQNHPTSQHPQRQGGARKVS